MTIGFATLSPLRLIWNLDSISQEASPLVKSFRDTLSGVRAVSQAELHLLDASHFDDKGMACLLLKDALLSVSGKMHKLDSKEFVIAREEDPLRSRSMKGAVINLAHQGNVLLERMNPVGQSVVVDQTLTQPLADLRVGIQKLREVIEKLEVRLPTSHGQIWVACMSIVLSETADAVTSLSAGVAGQMSSHNEHNNATAIASGEGGASSNWEPQAHLAAFALKFGAGVTALWAAVHAAQHSRESIHSLRVTLDQLDNVVDQIDVWREDPAGLEGLKNDIEDSFFRETQPSVREQIVTMSRNLADWVAAFLQRDDPGLPVSQAAQHQQQPTPQQPTPQQPAPQQPAPQQPAPQQPTPQQPTPQQPTPQQPAPVAGSVQHRLQPVRHAPPVPQVAQTRFAPHASQSAPATP